MSEFPIPKPFKWDASFQVFYSKLDEEHKGLFQGIFDVDANRSSGDSLTNLRTRVSNHFASEEKAMDDASFACQDHKQKHKEFVDKLAGLSCPVAQGTIDYAMDWLVNHIKGTDFKYKGKLNLAA